MIIIKTGKKRYSRLSVGCAVLAITTGKEKDTVVCLAGCAVVLCQFLVMAGNWQFFVVAGNFYYDRKKKIQSSVWRVRDHYYDWKKKIQLSVCWVRGSGD